MDVMNYSDARAQFKSVMDRAIHDKQEVVVTRKKGEAVVVLSLEAWEDYQHWVETNSKLKNRINELIKQCKRTPIACVPLIAQNKGEAQSGFLHPAPLATMLRR